MPNIGDVIMFQSAVGDERRALVFETFDDADTVSLVYVQADGRIEKHQGVRRAGASERRYVPTDYEKAKLKRLIDDDRKADADKYAVFISRPMGSAAGTWK